MPSEPSTVAGCCCVTQVQAQQPLRTPTVCGYEQPTKQRQQLPAHMVPKQGWMHDSQAAMPLTTAAIRPSALHAGKPACHRLLALRTESLNKGMHGAAANTSMLRLTLA